MKTKKLQSILAIVMMIVMVLGLTVTSTYAAEEKKIVVEHNNQYANGQEYTAYEVFKGDLVDANDRSKGLKNIVWGSDINDTAFVNALKATTVAELAELKAAVTAMGTDVTAAKVAEAISQKASSAAAADALARIIDDNLKNGATGTVGTEVGTGATAKTEITVPNYGYYFVKQTSDPAVTTEGTAPDETLHADSASKFMLRVVGTTTVKAKDSTTLLTKKIRAERGETTPVVTDVDANQQPVGGVENYQLKSKVPQNLNDYKWYEFVVSDIMSKGLTFNDDVALTIGGTSITVYDSTTAIPSPTPTTTYAKVRVVPATQLDPNAAAGSTAFTVQIFNIKAQADKAGQDIVFDYSATVNGDARYLTEMPNKAKLTYTRNPNETYDYDYDNPNRPKGDTPWDEVKTYTGGLILNKVDDVDNSPLQGAGFTISGVSSKEVIVSGIDYVKNPDANPAYYLLKDGSYTSEAPNGVAEHDAVYASTTDKYECVTYTNEHRTETTTVMEEVFVDANGQIKWDGIGAGTYTIEETTVPVGYTKAPNRELVIKANYDSNGDFTHYTATLDGVALESAPGNSNFFKVPVEFTVVNTKNTNLPETGGIGTTIFYVVGALLVVGAVVTLVTKRRMSR